MFSGVGPLLLSLDLVYWEEVSAEGFLFFYKTYGFSNPQKALVTWNSRVT
jgi:hypothetical protein